MKYEFQKMNKALGSAALVSVTALFIAGCGSFARSDSTLQSESGSGATDGNSSVAANGNSSTISGANCSTDANTLKYAYYASSSDANGRSGQVIVLSSDPNMCDSGNLTVKQGNNDVVASVVIEHSSGTGVAEINTHASAGANQCYLFGDSKGKSTSPGQAFLSIFPSQSGETISGTIEEGGKTTLLPGNINATACNFPTDLNGGETVACSAATSSFDPNNLKYAFFHEYPVNPAQAGSNVQNALVVYLTADANFCANGANLGSVTANGYAAQFEVYPFTAGGAQAGATTASIVKSVPYTTCEGVSGTCTPTCNIYGQSGIAESLDASSTVTVSDAAALQGATTAQLSVNLVVDNGSTKTSKQLNYAAKACTQLTEIPGPLAVQQVAACAQ